MTVSVLSFLFMLSVVFTKVGVVRHVSQSKWHHCDMPMS